MNNKLFMNLISLVYLMIVVGVVVCNMLSTNSMLSTNLMLLSIIMSMMIWSIVIAMVDSEYINYEKH